MDINTCTLESTFYFLWMWRGVAKRINISFIQPKSLLGIRLSFLILCKWEGRRKKYQKKESITVKDRQQNISKHKLTAPKGILLQE